MKKTIIIAVIIIAAALLFVVYKGTKTNKLSHQKTEISQSLNWKQFQEKAQEKNTVVIDVRTANEYNTGKLFPDARVDFDYYQADFENKISKLDKNKTYLIYCHSGNRSGKSLKIFEKYGLKAYNLDGGVNAAPNGSLK